MCAPILVHVQRQPLSTTHHSCRRVRPQEMALATPTARRCGARATRHGAVCCLVRRGGCIAVHHQCLRQLEGSGWSCSSAIRCNRVACCELVRDRRTANAAIGFDRPQIARLNASVSRNRFQNLVGVAGGQPEAAPSDTKLGVRCAHPQLPRPLNSVLQPLLISDLQPLASLPS